MPVGCLMMKRTPEGAACVECGPTPRVVAADVRGSRCVPFAFQDIGDAVALGPQENSRNESGVNMRSLETGNWCDRKLEQRRRPGRWTQRLTVLRGYASRPEV